MHVKQIHNIYMEAVVLINHEDDNLGKNEKHEKKS